MNQTPFRYFKTSREIIQIAVMMYIRFPLSLRNVEDLLHERGIDICRRRSTITLMILPSHVPIDPQLATSHSAQDQRDLLPFCRWQSLPV